MIKKLRGNGTAYLKTVGDNRFWVFEIRYEDETGAIRKKTIKGSSERDAWKKGLKFIDDFRRESMDESKASPYASMTFYEFALKELKDNQRNKVKDSTYCTYKRTIEYIPDALKGICMYQLNTQFLVNILNEIVESGKSQSIVDKTFQLITRCCKYYSLLTGVRNCSLEIEKPIVDATKNSGSDTKNTVEFFKLDELDKLEKLFLTPNISAYGNILYFILNTGLTSGEARALTWNDVDLDKRKIMINKSVNKGVVENGVAKADKEFIGTPKSNSSYRVIRITQKVYDLLVAQKALSLKSEYVFPGLDNGFITRSAINKAALAYYKKGTDDMKTKSGVKILRDTFAVKMVSENWSISVLSKHLGNSNLRNTEKYYPQEIDELIMNELSNSMKNGQ